MTGMSQSVLLPLPDCLYFHNPSIRKSLNFPANRSVSKFRQIKYYLSWPGAHNSPFNQTLNLEV